MEVSKGTYIRSLVHDIGQDIGCGAYVESLCRTAIVDVLIDNCYSLEELEQNFASGNLHLINAVEELGFPIVEPDEKMIKRVKNGSSLRNNSQ